MTTPGVFDPNTGTWFLRNELGEGGPSACKFAYGAPGWRAVTGDWKGSGNMGIGVVDPATNTWFLRHEIGQGGADAGTFRYGAAGWIPLVGDWDGDGTDGIGVFDPSTGTFYLRNEANAGAPDAGVFRYGGANWIPIVGDWDGDGRAGVGVVDPASNTFFLRNALSQGVPDAGIFRFGAPGWAPVVGDWDGDGDDSIGAVDPSNSTYFLRNELSEGVPDAGKFAYGGKGWQAFASNFKNAPSTLFPISNLLTQVLNTNGTSSLQVSGNVGSTPFSFPLTFQLPTSSSSGSSGSSTSTGGTSTGSAASTTSSTPILTLHLDPIHLNLLGLKVDTSAICLDISAQSGSGNLLGNLLTQLANALNGGQTQSQALAGLTQQQVQDLTKGLNSLLSSVLTDITSLLGTTPTVTNGTGGTGGTSGTGGTGSTGGSGSTNAGTNVLTLSLGPVNLNLLGLNVHLDNCNNGPVTVSITAVPGPGNLLGNLISKLAHLLDGTSASSTAILRHLQLIARDIESLI